MRSSTGKWGAPCRWRGEMGEEEEEGGRATPSCLGWGSGAFVTTTIGAPRKGVIRCEGSGSPEVRAPKPFFGTLSAKPSLPGTLVLSLHLEPGHLRLCGCPMRKGPGVEWGISRPHQGQPWISRSRGSLGAGALRRREGLAAAPHNTSSPKQHEPAALTRPWSLLRLLLIRPQSCFASCPPDYLRRSLEARAGPGSPPPAALGPPDLLPHAYTSPTKPRAPRWAQGAGVGWGG